MSHIDPQLSPITVQADLDQFTRMPVTSLRPSPDNPRKHFEPSALADLAANVRAHGIISPIVVRPVVQADPSSARFEIVSGERRWRAAQMAGLAEVPVRILLLSDAAALEIQVVENLQRSDIHELEEADGYKALQARYGYTVEDLAAKVGKSETYIYGRLKLCSLVNEKAREAFFNRTIAPTVALFIARLPERLQEDAAVLVLTTGWDRERGAAGPMPTSEAISALKKRFSLRLASAPFSLESELLISAAGSCTSCPKRTGNQLAIFPTETPDVCTDPVCFAAKVARHHEVTIATAREAGQTIIEGKAARSIFPSNYDDQASGGYIRIDTAVVDYDEDTDQDVELPSWRQQLGAHCPPPTIVINPHTGTPAEVLTVAEFTAAAEKAGLKVPVGMDTPRGIVVPPRDPEQAAKDKATKAKEEAKRQERLQRSLEVAAAATNQIADAIKTAPLDSGVMADALRFVLASNDDSGKVLSDMGLLLAHDDAGFRDAFDRRVAKATENMGAREITSLLVRVSLYNYQSAEVPGVDRYTGEYTQLMKALVGLFADKVSIKDLEREATSRRLRAAAVAAQADKADAAIAASKGKAQAQAPLGAPDTVMAAAMASAKPAKKASK